MKSRETVLSFGKRFIRSFRPTQLSTSFSTMSPAEVATSTTRVRHPLISKLLANDLSKIAIRHIPSGNQYSYEQLLKDISGWRQVLGPYCHSSNGCRIAIMGENSYQFTAVFYAALTLSNTLAMPLCTNHTQAEIEYQLNDSRATVIVTPNRFVDKVQFAHSQAKILVYEDQALTGSFDDIASIENCETSGHILYTSGTSGNPKGVVTPLHTFAAQAAALTKQWDISEKTNFLHTLPLHHVHGLLIALTLPLLAGGRVEFLFPFSPEKLVSRLFDNTLPQVNTYTAVPTIYTRLTAYLKTLSPEDQGLARTALQSLRLAMCGSAALPAPLRDSWESFTDGKVPLLERYGMTETGITLSQSLDPYLRRNGTVGGPVPSVVARLVETDTNKTVYQSDGSVQSDGAQGEIQLSGPVIFKEYWGKPEATAETFSSDGWFKTGDIAQVDKYGNLAILGRASMDIIKSGGEKISALEIEREILGLSQVLECSVLGVPSEEWGEEVSVVAVLSEQGKSENFGLEDLKAALRQTLARWKIPKKLVVVDMIPRNQMGKVNKKNLKSLFDQ
jgi:malonyl-CoA/methylmalonyl-CoA synthetase